MHAQRRLLLSACGPVLFGVLFAIAKGQSEGFRNALGNVSAPWLLVPFAVGMLWPRLGRAALAGGVASVLALAGFYGALSFIYNLAPNPWYVDVQRTFSAGSMYFMPGIATGLVFGALGGLWSQYRLLVAALAAALALLCEPLALHVSGIDRGAGNPLRYPVLWLTEMCLGAALSGWAVSGCRASASRELQDTLRRRLDL